jgi:6-phosphofructo-2-kinase / fructose-2,6-biphosphatase 4
MIIRYLRWIGYEAEVFNVGSYRRKMGLSGIDASYFAEGREASANREQLAMAVQEMMYEWLHSSDGSVSSLSALHLTSMPQERPSCNL